jgi:type IV secretory pathway VirB3-like protein
VLVVVVVVVIVVFVVFLIFVLVVVVLHAFTTSGSLSTRLFDGALCRTSQTRPSARAAHWVRQTSVKPMRVAALAQVVL